MTAYVSVFGLVRQWIHFYVSLQRPGLSCRGAEVDSHGLAVQHTMVSPQLQFIIKVVIFHFEAQGPVPVVQVEQVHFPVVTQGPIPMVRPVGGPQRFRSCSTRRVVDVPVVQVELVSWCRREGDSRDLTAAAVEKSLAPGGSGSSPWWSWVEGDFFWALYTGTGPGVVSTGTRPP